MEAASVEATAMETTSKTRLSAGRKASDISAVIKATERAGAQSWLSVKGRCPVERITAV
jgi:hypothetical protein